MGQGTLCSQSFDVPVKSCLMDMLCGTGGQGRCPATLHYSITPSREFLLAVLGPKTPIDAGRWIRQNATLQVGECHERATELRDR